MTKDFVVLERIWPPAEAPPGWLSHIGGWPNLPADLPWPRVTLKEGGSAALDFLAQIDLSAMPEVYERGLLPRRGMLYFFAVSQTPMPFEEVGEGAWRVLYHPQSAAGIPPRPPPEDTGWGLDDSDHARTLAADFRDPEAPSGDLHPYCPVRPVRAEMPDEEEDDRPSRPVFEYDRRLLPLRVEDAVLHINFARNSFFENVIPLKDYLARLTAKAMSSRRFALQPRPGRKPGSVPGWATYVLSDHGLTEFAAEYGSFRQSAVALTAALLAQGRSSMLSQGDRERVLQLFAEASALYGKVNPYKLFAPNAQGVAQISLATLLRHDPGLALQVPVEVQAAYPPDPAFRNAHRMFGTGRSVQGGTLTGAEPFLLLQLESDSFGPRFMWWDCGNLSFWLSTRDAAARRFDLATAEIEGH